LALVAVLPGVVLAQNISSDGRFSRAQTLIGPNYTIDATLGRQVGSNLFHSFGKFGLATGESAIFTATGASGPISNVVGRVTGGAPSSIDGRIQSDVAGANLYLINPSGIVFGPNATINVSGSFRAATADYLRMDDGARFQATNPDASTLSAAPPAAFGFLSVPSARITVNGSALTAPAGRTLALVGGPVSIDQAALVAPGGQIAVTSAASSGEVPAATGAPVSTAVAHGKVDINRSSLNVSDPTSHTSGGTVRIHAGAMNMASGEINADNFGVGAGGLIALRSDDAMTLASGVAVHADAQGTGTGGNISIRAGSLLAASAIVQSKTFGPNNAGDITVLVNGAASFDGASGATGIIASSGPSSAGNSGNITLASGSLSLAGGAQISSSTRGSGKGGIINIDTGALTMLNQGQISSNTSGSGAAGDLSLDAGILSLTDAFTQISSSTSSSGRAGDVSVTAGSAIIRNLAEINAGTTASGNGGTVRVTVARDLTIIGPPSDNPFLTGISSVADPGSTGNAGKVGVTAGRLSISGFTGEISSSTLGSGSAGDVSVQIAGPLSISGPVGTFFPTGIISESLQSPPFVSNGNAGNVSIGAQNMALVAGGAVASRTTGAGSGGTVSVITPGALLLNGQGTQIAASALGTQSGPGGTVSVIAGGLTVQAGATIASSSLGPGKGGDVTINAADIILTDPGATPQISANSRGTGDAGSITVTAVNLQMKNSATISTDAATANGGNINISVHDLMYLVDSQITTSVKGAFGNGGNIFIDPRLLVLQRSSIIAQAVRGHGGNITIIADQYLPSADSIVSATSQLGISGTVELIGPRVDLNGSLVVLSSELRAAAEILRDSCAARSALPRSSLTDAGRGGLPQDPETMIPALYLAGRDAEGESTDDSISTPMPFVRHGSLHVTTDCGV
jgi:filamentous hemagglutinin family protein